MTVWPQDKERTAKCVDVLRAQVDAIAPDRNLDSDGTRASAQHHAQNPTSDHEARFKYQGWGIVTAIDFTHDPAGGCDAHALAETLKDHKDPRVKYLISKRRIWNPSISDAWRSYNGANPHTEHCHVSMVGEGHPELFDSEKPWDLTGWAPKGQPRPGRAKLKRGDKGPLVAYLQGLLGFPAAKRDGDFGPVTENAVEAIQNLRGLVADGIVGTYTWQSLEERPVAPAPVTSPTSQPEPWNLKITASVFGGSVDSFKERSAYDNHVISNTELAVALPWRFSGTRPKVEIRRKEGSQTFIAAIEDVGPWLIADNYFLTGARPIAETSYNTGLVLPSGPNKGRRAKNPAGIDLSPALASKLGIDGMGTVDFRIVA